MNKFRFFFVAVLIPLVLSACQTAQVGTNGFARAVPNGAAVKQSVVINEAASSAVKPTAQSAKKKVAAKRSGPRVFVNEAASSAIRPVPRKASTTKVTSKGAKKSSKKTRTAKASSRKRGGKFSSRRSRYRKIIAKHARANGVPVRLAMAVVHIESSYRANARGAAGEIGLMQLMPTTARFIGYKGPLKRLYHPDTNIRFGMKYLGKAYRLGGGSVCGAILKYNAGHGAKRMNPISRKYCKRVRRIMRRG